MNGGKNSKLCWHCEGEVDRDAIYCLHCGADLTAPQREIPDPLYQQAKVEEAAKPEANELPFSIPGFVLLLMGALLLVFSFFLLFFSEEGVLTLKWDASYWFVYLLLALPLFILGFRLSKK